MSHTFISGLNWDSGDFVEKFCLKCKKLADCIEDNRWCINPIGSQFEPITKGG